MARPRRPNAAAIQSWLLVVSAFLLGAALSAAVFVGIWRTTASRGDRAEAAKLAADRHLNDVTERASTLNRKLHRTKRDLAATLVQKRKLKVQLRSAIRQAAASSQAAAADRSTALTVQQRASKVASYVASLKAYVEATPTQDLDAAFLASQLAYLSAATQRLKTG